MDEPSASREAQMPKTHLTTEIPPNILYYNEHSVRLPYTLFKKKKEYTEVYRFDGL